MGWGTCKFTGSCRNPQGIAAYCGGQGHRDLPNAEGAAVAGPEQELVLMDKSERFGVLS